MSALASLPEAKPFTVKVTAIGFEPIDLPPLHSIDQALPYLLGGQLNVVIMDDSVPSDLLELLKGRSPAEVARFVGAWVFAGADYETFILGEFLALERSLPELTPAESDEDMEAEFEAGIGKGNAEARQFSQHLDRIQSKIMETWRVMR